MDKKRVDGGSMASKIDSRKKIVHVARNILSFMSAISQEVGFVLRNAFISFARFRFGIKDSRVFTYLLRLKSKKDSIFLHQPNLKRVINLRDLSRRVRGVVLILSSQVKEWWEKKIINGRASMLGMEPRMDGYAALMETQMYVRTEYNRFLDSLVLANHPPLIGHSRKK